MLKKEYLIHIISGFLNKSAKKNEVYKFVQNETTYLAMKNLYDENESHLLILPSSWIRSEKIKEWLTEYLAITTNFKINSTAINKFSKSFEYDIQSFTKELKIIDLTLEDQAVFQKIFLQQKGGKLWRAAFEEHLGIKYIVTRKQELDSSDRYRELFNKTVFRDKQNKKVCVVSPFTYGKSALINSMIGQNTLSEDILVKTAKVTAINYGSQSWLMKAGHQIFLEKYNDIHNFKSRLNYLSTINEQKNHIIHVTMDSPILKNLTLIDTPGLFGKYAQHDEITENIIKDVDHIIYLLNPTQLGFEPYTRKIIEWQKKYNKRCVFVMNKIDLVKEELDRQRLIDEFEGKLGRLILHDGLFLVSAYSALKARLYKKNEIDLMNLKKDLLISVTKDNELISGRNFTEECVEILEKESGVLKLESYFKSIYGGEKVEN